MSGECCPWRTKRATRAFAPRALDFVRRNHPRSPAVEIPLAALEKYLRAIPLFSQVEPAQMPELLHLLRSVTLEQGQVLFREGTPGRAMWVLGEGTEVTISATPPGGARPVVVARARGGEVVGEMALIDEGLRSGSAVVVSGGPAHVIDAPEFQTLRAARRPVAFTLLRRICKDLCRRLRVTSDRIIPPSQGGALHSPTLALGPRPTSELVDRFEPFRALPDLVKLALAQKLHVVRTEAVQPIFGEREVADAAYFIVEGEVTVGRNGQTLATMGPGQMFGLIAVIDDAPRAASCVTSGPTTLLRLSNEDFDALFAQGNRFAFHMVDLVARQLVGHLREANTLLVALPGQARSGSTAKAMSAGSIEEALASSTLLPLELELELG